MSTAPLRLAGDAWLVRSLHPTGDGWAVHVNAMVLAGAEPVLVDTGARTTRDGYLSLIHI